MQLRYLDELHQVGCCIFRFLGQYDILQRAQLPRSSDGNDGDEEDAQNAEARFQCNCIENKPAARQPGASKPLGAYNRYV